MESCCCEESYRQRRHTAGTKPSCPLTPALTRARQQLHQQRSDAENGNRRAPSEAEHLQTDPEQAEHTRRKPALVRSKTFDHSLLSQVQPDPDAKIERKKSHYSQLSKTNSQYHKIFKEICKEEQLRQSYTCALQKDILYQGRLFVSDNWICFHSKVFGKDTKIAIPVEAVTNIKKTKTAILLPNALVIATTNDKHVFVSFLSRDNTYKFLMSSCLHLEEKSPCSSPIPSAESSFRSQRSPRSPRSPHFPMNFAGDFIDLDGTVRHRRQDTEESSSSDSQTPDYEKLPEFPVPPFLEVLKQGENPADHTEHKVKNQAHNPQNADTKQQEAHYTATKVADVVIDSRTLKPVSLNTLLLVYLFLVFILVLSSCYMALKIISLEQRLTSLGSITDLTQDESEFLRPELNAEIYSELSLNLIKLEKVQRNLQRLLDEAN